MNMASLQNFVLDEGLMFCAKSENCINIDYTYFGLNQFFSSVIGHFIISRCLSSSIAVYKTMSSMSNILSDHVPLFLAVEWHSPKSLTY